MAEGPTFDNEDREYFDKRFREIAERLEAKGLTPRTSKWWSADVAGTVYHFGVMSYCKARGSRLGQRREQEATEAVTEFEAEHGPIPADQRGSIPEAVRRSGRSAR